MHFTLKTATGLKRKNLRNHAHKRITEALFVKIFNKQDMLFFVKKQTGTTQKSLDNRGQIVKIRKNKPRDLYLSTVNSSGTFTGKY